jgi:hypothetical protein
MSRTMSNEWTMALSTSGSPPAGANGDAPGLLLGVPAGETASTSVNRCCNCTRCAGVTCEDVANCCNRSRKQARVTVREPFSGVHRGDDFLHPLQGDLQCVIHLGIGLEHNWSFLWLIVPYTSTQQVIPTPSLFSKIRWRGGRTHRGGGQPEE